MNLLIEWIYRLFVRPAYAPVRVQRRGRRDLQD